MDAGVVRAHGRRTREIVTEKKDASPGGISPAGVNHKTNYGGRMKSLIHKAELIVGCTAFFIMIAAVVANVFSRYLLGISLNFAEEIAYIGFTYSVFIGVCLLFKKHALIAIDVMTEKAPAQIKHALSIFNFFLLTILNAYLFYLAIKLTADAWIRPTAALRIPYTFIDFAAVYAFGQMSLNSAFFLIQTIRGKNLLTAQAEFLSTHEEV